MGFYLRFVFGGVPMNIIKMNHPHKKDEVIELVSLEELQPIIHRQEQLLKANQSLMEANTKLIDTNKRQLKKLSSLWEILVHEGIAPEGSTPDVGNLTRVE